MRVDLLVVLIFLTSPCWSVWAYRCPNGNPYSEHLVLELSSDQLMQLGNGEQITKWSDQAVPNNQTLVHNAVPQTINTNKSPTVKARTNILGGSPVASFRDGSYMSSSSSTWLSPSIPFEDLSIDRTIFMVVRVPSRNQTDKANKGVVALLSLFNKDVNKTSQQQCHAQDLLYDTSTNTVQLRTSTESRDCSDGRTICYRDDLYLAWYELDAPLREVDVFTPVSSDGQPYMIIELRQLTIGHTANVAVGTVTLTVNGVKAVSHINFAVDSWLFHDTPLNAYVLAGKDAGWGALPNMNEPAPSTLSTTPEPLNRRVTLTGDSDMAYVAIYNIALTDEDANKVGWGLQQKYNIKTGIYVDPSLPVPSPVAESSTSIVLHSSIFIGLVISTSVLGLSLATVLLYLWRAKPSRTTDSNAQYRLQQE